MNLEIKCTVSSITRPIATAPTIAIENPTVPEIIAQSPNVARIGTIFKITLKSPIPSDLNDTAIIKKIAAIKKILPLIID